MHWAGTGEWISGPHPVTEAFNGVIGGMKLSGTVTMNGQDCGFVMRGSLGSMPFTVTQNPCGVSRQDQATVRGEIAGHPLSGTAHDVASSSYISSNVVLSGTIGQEHVRARFVLPANVSPLTTEVSYVVS